MTKKTRAALAFAEKYGTWSPAGCLTDVDQYCLKQPPAGSTSSEATLIRHRADRDIAQRQLSEVRAERDKVIADRRAILKTVMALLGVEDQYEDTVETKDVFVGGYLGVYESREVVTETATQKFAKDLRAAQSAVEGEAALKRLRKAIKTVQKEQNK